MIFAHREKDGFKQGSCEPPPFIVWVSSKSFNINHFLSDIFWDMGVIEGFDFSGELPLSL